MNAKVIQGDCLEVLAVMGADTIDAIVTDPPAGIAMMGKKWDEDKGGRDHWIAWMQKIAAECLRVAKPGAHALVWALPRTSHWTAMAWERAGWEVRDRVSHVFFSGFPKSANISKNIDKTLGATREVVGRAKGAASNETESRGDFASEFDVTVPATPEAEKWNGYGTALKPAVEDWWLPTRQGEVAGESDHGREPRGGGAVSAECRPGRRGHG